MSSEADQLTNDFAAVQDLLGLYPNIKVIQVDGEPPDTYEIEYLVKGYMRGVDGSISDSSQHRIRISLPFGYPHFPPSVKPLTSIFHPDIDPDAVRIATFWQENPSLPDLIIYIGEMVCGKVYDLNDPFNQEAADWYAEHLDDLPLGSLQMAGVQLFDDQDEDSTDDTLEFLVLDDEDQETDEGEVADQVDEADEADDSEETEAVAAQLEVIQLHIDKKEIMEASRQLEDLPDTAPGKFGLEQAISTAINDCQQLLIKAEKAEDKGDFEEAFEIGKQANKIVKDNPALADLRKRLKQSQLMADTFSGSSTETVLDADDEATSPAKDADKDKKKSGRKKKARFESKQSKPGLLDNLDIPIIPIVLSLVAIAALGGGGMLYFKDTSALKKANSQWLQAQKLMDQHQYDYAEEEAQAALRSLGKVVVLGSKKKTLQVEISTLLNSEDFKRGIKGEVKYKGEFHPLEIAQTFQELDKLLAVAESLLTKGLISKAIPAYDKAKEYAVKNNLQVRAAEIETTVTNLRFEESKALASKAEAAGDWGNAAETYQRALALSKVLADDKLTGEISKKLAKVSFQHDFHQSKERFTSAQWKEAVDMLEHSKELLDKSPDAVTGEQRAEFDRLLAESRLFEILSAARLAYEGGDLDTAIKEYNRSLGLINAEQDILAATYGNATAKIKRTILMIEISRKQSAAVTAEQTKDIKRALTYYRETAKLIQQSGVSKDPTILAIEKKTRAKIQTLSTRVVMDSRKGWLMDHYEELFKKAYPSSRSSELTNPKVTFLKEEGGHQIFKITCSERSQGSSYGLELKYMYTPAIGKWSAYRGQ